MTEKERAEVFLSAFKELENEVLSIARIKDEGHVSFSRALNDIYYQRKNPYICDYGNYDFLKTCSDLRNILSHENDVCVPSESFLNRFIILKNKIIHPQTCYGIASKDIVSCTMDDSLFSVLKTMEYKSLSHIPVLDEDGVVQGIFSRTTIFDYVSMNEELENPSTMKVKDFMEFLPVDSHLGERFLFVSRYDLVDSIYPELFKNKEHDKNLALVLVTQHGRKTEKLLGVVTITDMAKGR